MPEKNNEVLSRDFCVSFLKFQEDLSSGRIDASKAFTEKTIYNSCLEALQTATAPLVARVKELENELERYEFSEAESHDLERQKTFSPEIESAHPMNSDGEEYKLALKLVGERHEKYELVDLVNWLLTFRARLEKAECELAATKVERDAADKVILNYKGWLEKAEGEKAAMFDNCKVVYWPKDGSYPIEHGKAANKIMSDQILDALNIKPTRLISPNHPVIVEMEDMIDEQAKCFCSGDFTCSKHEVLTSLAKLREGSL